MESSRSLEGAQCARGPRKGLLADKWELRGSRCQFPKLLPYRLLIGPIFCQQVTYPDGWNVASEELAFSILWKHKAKKLITAASQTLTTAQPCQMHVHLLLLSGLAPYPLGLGILGGTPCSPTTTRSQLSISKGPADPSAVPEPIASMGPLWERR